MLILASGSPRRQELMRIIDEDFKVITKDTSEKFTSGTPPDEVVRLLSLRKALAVAEDHRENIVIGADTVVCIDNRILEKPRDQEEAVEMLRLLSGRVHEVHTGVAVIYPGGREVFSQMTQVEFITMTDEQIFAYAATGEPMDKAGGYGIQGQGAIWISGINGDYYNVMGLPVCSLAKILRSLPLK